MTPDARLSAAERAALADLENAATAADPSLAARLRGSPAFRLRVVLPAVRVRWAEFWAALLRLRWWGVPIVAVGLVVIAVGVGAGVGVAVAGSVVTAVGIRILVAMAEERADKDGSAA